MKIRELLALLELITSFLKDTDGDGRIDIFDDAPDDPERK